MQRRGKHHLYCKQLTRGHREYSKPKLLRLSPEVPIYIIHHRHCNAVQLVHPGQVHHIHKDQSGLTLPQAQQQVEDHLPRVGFENGLPPKHPQLRSVMPPRKGAAAVAEQQPTTTRSSRSKTKAAAEAFLGGTESSVANNKPTARAGDGNAGASSCSQAMPKTKELSLAPPTSLKGTKKPASKKGAKEVQLKATAPRATKATKATKAPTEKVDGKAKIPAPARTTPPTESSAEPENRKASNISPVNISTEAVKLAEKLSTGIMRKRTRDAVAIDVVNLKEVVDTKHKRAKTTQTAAAAAKKKGARRYTPFTSQNVEAWFEVYQDEENDQLMSPAACNHWLEVLGISAESAAFYVLAWKLGAKTIFALTREEFVGGMKKLEYDIASPPY